MSLRKIQGIRAVITFDPKSSDLIRKIVTNRHKATKELEKKIYNFKKVVPTSYSEVVRTLLRHCKVDIHQALIFMAWL